MSTSGIIVLIIAAAVVFYGITIYNGRCCSAGDGLSALPQWLRALPDAYVQDWPHEWKRPKYWNTVLLDGSVPGPLVRDMIDESYALVVKGLTRKQRESLG